MDRAWKSVEGDYWHLGTNWEAQIQHHPKRLESKAQVERHLKRKSVEGDY